MYTAYSVILLKVDFHENEFKQIPFFLKHKNWKMLLLIHDFFICLLKFFNSREIYVTCF